MAEESRWIPGSPEDVLEQAFRAFRARDGYRLAALASPGSLQEYGERLHTEVNPQWHTWTPEALRAHDPEMPLEVAQWQAQRMERDRIQHRNRVLKQFAGVQHVEALEQMSTPELLDHALDAAPAQAIALGVCRIIGHVQEGLDRAYVLFWLGTEAERVSVEPRVAIVDRIEGTWRLKLDPFSYWGIPGFRSVYFPDESAGACAEDTEI